MTRLTRAPKDLAVVVCDTSKALMLSNSGTEIHPRLEISQIIEAPATGGGNQEADRPGRRYDGGAAQGSFHARSAMEANDGDRERALAFANQVSDALASALEDPSVTQILLVAPPEFLGILRDCLSAPVRESILASVPKHLTEQTVTGIQSALFEPW